MKLSPSQSHRKSIWIHDALCGGRIRSLFVAALLLLLIGLPSNYCAACQDDDLQDDDAISVFVQPPRELILPLQRAQRAIEQGDPAEAARVLAPVLTGEQAEDYLIRIAPGQPVAISMFAEAQRLLSSLPAEHRAAIEDRYGIEAQQLLNIAIEAGDYQQMSQIMRRYFHTKAGYLAAMLLGHHHLDQGRMVAAASCFQKVVECAAAADIHEPQASLLLATAWWLGGMPQKADQVLRDLRAKTNSTSVEFAGRQIPLFASDNDPLTWLTEQIGNSPLSTNRVVSEWLVFRGDPQRNAQSDSGFPLKYPRWLVPTLNDPAQESIVRSMVDEMRLGDHSLIPALQPLAMGDNILMRSMDRLIGIDFQTGDRQWMFPRNLFDGKVIEAQQSEYDRSLARPHFFQRLFDDALFGQFSSDGQYVFVIHDVGFAGGTLSPTIQVDGRFSDNPLGTARTNTLKAVDVASQGGFVWEVGGKKSPDEPQLVDCFFLGAALPLDHELYVLYEQKSEVRLACLEAATGRMIWSQHLANTESHGEIREDSQRRLAAASPSYSDGILVCPTSARAVVAVDLSTRGLAWGFEYSGVSARVRELFQQFNLGASAAAKEQKWMDSTVTLAQGCAVLTPVEDDQIYCIDLLSGQSRWSFSGDRIGVPRGDSLFVAGICQGQIILVGVDQLHAIDLFNGQSLWKVEFGQHGDPSGRGYFGGDSYYLPTTQAKVVRFDMARGVVADWVQTDRVLGNIIPFRGDIISHGVDFVACYPQLDRVAQVVANAEQQGSLTTELQIAKAQLLAHRGEFDAAVTQAREVYLATGQEQALLVTLELVLESIRADDESARHWMDEFAEELGQFRAMDYLDARFRAKLDSPDITPLAAVECWLDSLELLDGVVQADDRSTFRNASENLMVRVDLLHAEKIRQLWKTVADEDDRIHLASLSSKLAAAGDEQSLRKLHEIWRLLGGANLPAAARSELIDSLGSQKEYLAAEHVVFESIHAPETSDRAWARADYVRLLLAAGHHGRADRICAQLESEYSDVVCNVQGETGAEFAAASRPLLTIEDSHDSSESPRMMVCETSAASEDEGGYRSAAATATPAVRQFDSPIADELVFAFNSDNWSLEIRDCWGATLSKLQMTPLGYDHRIYVSGGSNAQMWLRGHLLMVAYGNQLTAINLFNLDEGNAAILWHVQTAHPAPARSGSGWRSFSQRMFTTSWGEQRFEFFLDDRRIGAVTELDARSVCCIIGDNLECLDVDTGRRQWVRGAIGHWTCVVGDPSAVGVVDGDVESCAVYSRDSGTALRETDLGPEVGRIWWQTGGALIFSSEEADPKTLTSIDLIHDQTLWTRQFAEGSRASIGNATRAAIYQPAAGMLEILDLHTGETQSSMELGPLRGVQSIDWYQIGNRSLLAVNLNQFHRSNVSDPQTGAVLQSLDYRQPLLYGYVYALDSDQQRLLWDSPAKIELFEVAGPVLPKCPLLLLNRVQSTENSRLLQMAAIDLQTGQLAFPVQSHQAYSRIFRAEVDPQTLSLDVVQGEKQFRIRYIEEAPPPRSAATLVNERVLGIQPPFPVQSREIRERQQRIDHSLENLQRKRLELEKQRQDMRELLPGEESPGGEDKSGDAGRR